MLAINIFCTKFHKRTWIWKNLVLQNICNPFECFVHIFNTANRPVIAHANINDAAIGIQESHNFLDNIIGVFLFQFRFFSLCELHLHSS